MVVALASCGTRRAAPTRRITRRAPYVNVRFASTSFFPIPRPKVVLKNPNAYRIRFSRAPTPAVCVFNRELERSAEFHESTETPDVYETWTVWWNPPWNAAVTAALLREYFETMNVFFFFFSPSHSNATSCFS